MTHATVSPARIRYWTDELRCNTLRGIGFQARYPDGTRGPIRKTRDEARADAKAWMK